MIKNSMKMILTLMVFTAPLAGQNVIENPEKPAARNAGRIIALNEILAVRDGGEDFIFNFPRDIKVATDGSFFVTDWEQLLQFDASGKFLRNYYKKGQGPGEMQWGVSFGFDSRTLVVSNGLKILRFDVDGRSLGEQKIPPKAGMLVNLLQAVNGRCDFVKYTPAPGNKKAEVIDWPRILVSVFENGKDSRDLSTFPTKVFILRGEGGGAAWNDINKLLTASTGDGQLFICHTQEYLVKFYDPASDKVLRTFRRKYDRVPPTAEEEERRKKPGAMMAGKPAVFPAQKYSNDVRALLVVDDRLWVLTSTVDLKKGVLTDVFDFEGRYLDCIYIPLHKSLAPDYKNMCVSGGRLYAVERNSDDTAVIRVYKIVDPGAK